MKRVHCLSLSTFAVALAVIVLALVPPGRASAQREPTMVISPASGPCDAPLEARGSEFPPPPGGPPQTLRLYLVQPGTADVNLGILNAASINPDGTFVARLGPGEPRCEAAALDSDLERPGGRLVIAASLNFEETGVGPGERIPDIVAVAEYAYTTTTVRVPTETLAISPPSGPCDATIEVELSGFDPDASVPIDIGRPHADGSLGTITSVTTDGRGDFTGEVALGDVGCEAASLDDLLDAPGEPKQIHVWAGYQPTERFRFVPARALYTYTTTQRGAAATPRTLPGTGSGPIAEASPPPLPPMLMALAGMAVLTLAASLRMRRRGK